MIDKVNTLLIRTGQLFESGTPVDIPKVEPTGAKVQSILFWVFTLMGSIAVLMITISGFKYVMSMGDPQATKKAKDTILYAFIGLMVAILSATIIKFVLGNL